MSNTNFPRFVLSVVVLAATFTLIGQSTKEIVILYNTSPVLAEVSADGHVKRIIKDEPDFLKGFTLKVHDYGKFVADASSPKSDVMPDLTSNEAFISLPFEPGYATLTDKAVGQLDKIVSYLVQNPYEKVVLATLSTEPSMNINNHRLNSIRLYLKLRGIDEGRITFSSFVGEHDVDEVRIKYGEL